jgi:hypothetical protein
MTPTVSLDITIRDDDGRPVPGATASGSFFQDRVVSNFKSPDHQGESDADGFVRLTGRDDIYVDVWARKAGYYDTTHRVIVRGGGSRQVAVLLREKRNPIAMHARDALIRLPEYDRDFGYDLLRGDLVMPGGKGTVTDIVLRVDRWAPNPKEEGAELTIRFPNPLDGQRPMEQKNRWGTSVYKTAYTAPADGYIGILQAHLKERLGPDPNSKTFAERHYEKFNLNKPFFLRIRSRQDDKGEVVAANYCKVAPGIDLYGWGRESPSPTVGMRHYCNPVPNDRNVEFDIQRNLNEKPKEDQYKVQEP